MTKPVKMAARKQAQRIIIDHVEYIAGIRYPLEPHLNAALTSQLARIKRVFAYKAKPRRGKS